MTAVDAFDPEAPLPGPPDPWAATDTPSARSGPPYHMTDMIAAEPALARRILGRLAAVDGAAAALATAIIDAAEASIPIVVTGCGTSEHAAQACVEILDDALAAAGRPRATLTTAQAFELSLAPTSGLVIGISHEGGTAATNAALEAARRAGGRTALVTVSDRSPGAALADIVVTTDELDEGW